ncbi:MAG: hypothetical protein BMS9Abin06_1066 [Gammaproteobacteria bacterium]|nr:MAG: hypothetical protein BMS9Abin06_1066 [Gammaproteobacteria bacterium]
MLRSRFSVLLITGLIFVGGFFWISQWHGADDTVTVIDSVPSIVVLPFENLSGDAGQEYLVDGVTDDLITGLARRSELLVIARDSSFFYQSRNLGIDDIAKQLNIRFILRGSVRRLGERTTVNVQLIDTVAGRHVWAENYDVPVRDLPILHEDVTRNIMSVLNVGSSAR